jgi:hypothetical protein
MAIHSWIRKLFASRTPRTIRKAPARRHLHVEILEDRLVLNSYTATTTADLIADIGLANAAGGVNTITLTAPNSSPYALTVVNNTTHGATGLPVIAAGDNLTIVGNGDTIQRSVVAGTPAFRLFDVAAGATLTLKSLTLHDGLAVGTGVAAQGGAIYGAGTLTLDGVTVSGNVAVGGVAAKDSNGSDAFGGGVYVAAGTATLTNVTFSANVAQGSDGSVDSIGLNGFNGGDAFGGGVYVAAGTATLTNVAFRSNSARGGGGGDGYFDIQGHGGSGGAASGGAIYVAAGSATLTNDTLSDNSAYGGRGGNGGDGFFTLGVNQSGDATVGSGGRGGDASGGGLSVAGGTATLTNDTLVSNVARGGNGGDVGYLVNPITLARVAPASALYAKFPGDGGNASGGGVYVAAGTATLTNDTLTGNSAQGGNIGIGDGFYGGNGTGGGVSVLSGTSTTLANTLIAGNAVTAGTGRLGGTAAGPDVSGAFASSDHDLIGDGSGSNLTSGVRGDQVGSAASPINPLLGPLQNNGGPTATRALLPGSPAIDAGDNSLLPAGVSTDQRGRARIAGSAIDIGAFETQGFTLNVTSGNNQSALINTTFERALRVTVTPNDGVSSVAGGRITFSAPSSGPGAGFWVGPVVTIAADGTADAVAGANGNLGSYNVAANTAGAVGPATFTLTNQATVPLTTLRSAITAANSSATPTTITLATDTIYYYTAPDNFTDGGNALPVITGNITIIGNGATIERVGGPRFRLFDVAGGGSLNLQNVTLQGGYAWSNSVGGAIYSAGTLTLDGVTLSGNIAQGGVGDAGSHTNGGDAFGGGVYVAAGTATLTNDTFRGNTAQGGNGGDSLGILNLTATNGGNASGGGLYVAGGTATLTNDTFSGNTAQGGNGGNGYSVGDGGFHENGGSGGNASGGGLSVAAGTVTLTNDTLSGNSARAGNGGLGGLGISSSAGGSGGNASGGGLSVAGGTVTLTNDTLSGNSAQAGNGARSGMSGNGGNGGNGTGGGVFVLSGGLTTLANTLIAGNAVTAGTGGWGSIVAGAAGTAAGPDVSGTFASSDHDLIGDGSGSNLTSGVRGDQVGSTASPIDPLLGPLQNNGGPTATRAPLPGSPAVDAGNTNLIPAGVSTDQRGFARIVGAAVDIGALERQQPTITGITVPVLAFEGHPVALSVTATDPDSALTYAWTITRPDGSTLTTLSGASVSFTPSGHGNFGFRLTASDSFGGSATRTSTLTVYSQLSMAKFVQTLYQRELGRTAAATEVDGWAGVLAGTGGEAAVASGIVNSTEAHVHVVTGWFQTYLGRTPSTSETSFWANLLSGQTEEQVLSQIVGSTEFYSRAQGMGFGGTPAQNYVQALYKLLLGRTAGSTELTNQVNALPQLGQQGLALSILQSVEYRANVVRSYYANLLGRAASQTEVAANVNSGLDLRAIRVNIESSVEFFSVSAGKAPTITSFTVPATGKEGSPVTLSAAANNAAGNFYLLTYTWTVTRPDGTTLTTLNGASATFTPPDNGNYGVRLTVTDEDGFSASRTATDAVANVAPTITSIGVSNGSEGSPAFLWASANDPAGANDPLTYTWTVSRPDGTTLTTVTGNFTTFVPPDNGNYGVSLTVSDGDGGVTSLPAGGLVSSWQGEGNANDARGGNSGALVGGVSYAPGKVGQAFNFDGTGRVQVADAANLSLTTAATLEAWINPSALTFSGGFGQVIAKGSGSSRNYGLFVTSTGALHLSYFTTSGANVVLQTADNLVPAGQFSHVAAVIDPGAGVMQIYLNGQLVGSRATAGPLVVNTSPLTIGSTPGGGFGFKGLIDEATVYNRALSQIEIQSVVNAGSIGKFPSVAVANVAPTPEFTFAYSTGLATQVLNYVVGATDLSPIDQAAGFAYSFDWGDGSPIQTVPATAGNGIGVLVSHAYATGGAYPLAVTVTDKDGGASSITSTTAVLDLTSANLQTVINQQGAITFLAASNTQTSAVVAAIDGLSAQSTPVNVTLNLGGGSYTTDTHVTAPAGVTLVVANGTLIGGSPALIVDSGVVLLDHVTTRNATNAPTIVVNGGSLTLRNDDIEETTLGSQPALLITGGTVDLGTTASPGGNTFNAHGNGELIHNSGRNNVPAVGNSFAADGVAITSPYRVKDRIFDALNSGGGGLVGFVANQVYVTPTSGSIQRGVDAVAAGGTVNVEAGSYNQYDAGSKLVTVAFQNGPVLTQQADALNPDLRTLVVQGTPGNDTIVFNTGGSTAGTVQVLVNDLPPGTFSPTGRLIAYGGAGDDDIQVAGGLTLPAWLYGGDGNDRLKGGGGNNVLLGGAGDDQLIGGGGRNLLVGGLGADKLNAGGGGDLLIGGTTAFDANEAALAAVMDEWTSGRDYATWIANLSGTGSGPRNNDNYFLKVSGPDATVFDDGAIDVLQGGSGMDWFFASLSQDILHGRHDSEIVENL